MRQVPTTMSHVADGLPKRLPWALSVKAKAVRKAKEMP